MGSILKELKGSLGELHPGPIIKELKGSLGELRPGPIISELKGSLRELRPGPIISELKGSMGGMSPGPIIKGLPGYLRRMPASLSGKLPPGYGRKIAIALLILLVLFGIGGFLPISNEPHMEWIGEGQEIMAMWHVGPFFISGTLIASWLTIVVLIGLYFAATRKMSLIPKGIQNAVEMVNEMLLNFCEEVAGEENGRRFFPVVATIFLYVIMGAFLCLLPGFGTIGFGHYGSYSTTFYGTVSGFVVERPLLFKATTDITIPLMLALMSFIFVEYWGTSSLGFRRYVSRFIRIGGLRAPLGQLFRGKVRTAISGLVFAVIDMFAGFIELLSEFIRIISFTFRLFGNMSAGEILIIMICVLVPLVVAVPFYGLEMILGFVQALIFGGLTLVFATLAVRAHGAEE